MKNFGDLLLQAANLPAAIEAKLPTGAPKLSTMLTDTAGKLPKLPDLPVTLPDLPAVPELPAMPGGAALRKYVTGVTVIPAPAPPYYAPPPGRIPTPTPTPPYRILPMGGGRIIEGRGF